MELKEITPLTHKKYLNLFEYCYDINGKPFIYYVASRRSVKALEVVSEKTDAVRILPIIRQDDEIFVLLIKEFRYAVNDYIYELPAGLVENGETPINAACRELLEETGAKVKSITKIQEKSFSSAGLTDETIECFEAEIDLLDSQHLDDNEIISVHLVELEELPNLLKTEKFCMQSALLLQAFYYREKLNQAYEEKDIKNK